MTGVVKEHLKGLFKDGRRFEITDFRDFKLSDDGTIQDGTVGVIINGLYGVYKVSEIAKLINYESYNNK